MSSSGTAGPRKRPVGVWIIAIFYVISVVWTVFSYSLILSGAFPVSDAQRAYFDSLTPFDWLLAASLLLLGMGAAVSLFLLRRVSARLFTVVFVLNVATTLWQVFRPTFGSFAAAGALPGLILGILIQAMILFYVLRLEKRGVLV